MKIFKSNSFSRLEEKIPTEFIIRKKIHYFSFTPLIGFFPWSLEKETFELYSFWFPFTGIKILFNLERGEKNKTKFSCEIYRKGLIMGNFLFNQNLYRRKYNVSLIRTSYIIQVSLSEGVSHEYSQFFLKNSGNLGFSYGPVMERNDKKTFIIID
jgi:hypothetical protein